MATKRSTLKSGFAGIRGSSGAATAKKFGNKMAPGDGALPRTLRTVQSADLPASPKGRRVGPLEASAPTPPVAVGKRAKRGTDAPG